MRHIKEHARHIKKLKEHRVLNNLLTVITVLLALYIILAPLLPQATWVIQEESPAKKWLSRSDDVQVEAEGTIGSNRLFIPRLGLEEFIYEGGLEQLQKGVLHRGQSNSPDRRGNTVLVGHRFMYSEKGVFYHLDKLSAGDSISVHWENFKYDYRVTEVFVVDPSEVSIEASTSEDILTLYTCTPLWSSKERLVVRAKLQEKNL